MIRNSFRCSLFLLVMVVSSCKPAEDVQFRQVRNIEVEAVNNEPMLRAQAVLFNPNNVKMKLRRIDIEVFVDGKRAALINQQLALVVPANDEFVVPLEAKLNLKELGFFDTLFGVLGGKKMKVEYKGSIGITYKAIPIKVPVNYKSDIRVKL